MDGNSLTGDMLCIDLRTNYSSVELSMFIYIFDCRVGSIPSSIYSLSALSYLYLCCNSLTGDISDVQLDY